MVDALLQGQSSLGIVGECIRLIQMKIPELALVEVIGNRIAKRCRTSSHVDISTRGDYGLYSNNK